ncbi:ABC transporter ATP-binding protein [Chloroflexota bacterium]
MSAITVDNLSKKYRKGQVGYRTLREDLYKLTGQLIHLKRGGRKRYEERYIWALKDVSFQVEPGERLGIIGANGSGKTTLLRLLAGITSPTEGRISLKGRMGVLIELMAGFHPELTGRENIYLNGAIMGMSRKEIKRRFDEIVSFSELEEFIDTPIKRYSSGMHVRLGFALSAHMDPDILLVDEVLAVGDAEFQKKCLGKMSEAAGEGRTVVFVSHNMGSIANLCPKAIWLDKGKLTSWGDTSEIISDYILNRGQSGGEVSWDDIETAPGNENVRLKAVRIKSNHVVTSNVPIDKEIVIEMDYWNLKEEAILITGIHLKDKMNSYILASANLPSANLSVDPWFDNKRPKGIYRSRCIIPANLLNNEYYAINVHVQNQRNEWQAHAESVISFLVHDTGNMRAEYSGHWVGVIRPRLTWSTDFLTKSNS